jgi:hypothetical protein
VMFRAAYGVTAGHKLLVLIIGCSMSVAMFNIR